MIEKTLILLKPDAFERNLDKELFILLQRECSIRNFQIEKFLIFNKPSLKMIEKHYEEHMYKHFYYKLISFMRKGPIMALIIIGDNSISEMRQVAFNIRNLYGVENEKNLIHSSDSIESAKKEINNILSFYIQTI